LLRSANRSPISSHGLLALLSAASDTVRKLTNPQHR
jgi:hypothetical protein